MNRSTVAAAYLLSAALIHIGVAAQPAAPASAPTSYFSDLDAAVSRGLQVTAPRQKKDLGFIDRWRYESCLTDAAKNPTSAGVNLARRVCDQKFGQ
jgi:hypothetical protein